MCRVVLSAILFTTSVLALAGCESQQSKVDALQKEYDDLEGQFRKDCSQAYLQAQPTLSPKCTEEDKKAKDAWARLQAERAKK
jgi:hypothetical protein